VGRGSSGSFALERRAQDDGVKQATEENRQQQGQKQIPPLRCGMTNKKNRQRQGQRPIRRFWLRQNDEQIVTPLETVP
jgi:hypothetical protein